MEKMIRFKEVQIGQRFKQSLDATVCDTKIETELGSMVAGRGRLQLNALGDDGIRAQIADDTTVYIAELTGTDKDGE